MIGLNRRIIEMSLNAKLAISFGENFGWALYTPQQFFKGSFIAKELPAEFFEKIQDIRTTKISYRSLSKGDQIAFDQAIALSKFCKEKAIPMVAYGKIDITNRFLTKNYESKTLSGQVTEEATNRSWNCADSQAAMALAIMECERNG